jgi:hypothetical protein
VIARDVKNRNGPVAEKVERLDTAPDITCQYENFCPMCRRNRPSVRKPTLKVLEVNV